MLTNKFTLALSLLLSFILTTWEQFSGAQEVDTNNWHQWRGPEFNGVSRTATPPLNWSETQNVQWKIPIPGKGSSTPIVWGDKVFLLTGIDTGTVNPDLPKPEDQPDRVFGIKYPNTYYELTVLCFDRKTGAEIWRDVATKIVPHEGTHNDNDFASASPVVDNDRIYCWFGSAGLFCYDLDGNKKWNRNLGNAYIGASLGEGTSPVVHNNRVVILRDHQRQSTIEVLNTENGETIWRKDRDEPNTWATPVVVQHSGKTQIITSGQNFVRSYNLNDGSIIWQCSGLSENAIPCPVVDGDYVYCMSGYKGYSLLALPLNSTGDISKSDKIAWTRDRATPYIPSPLLYDGMLFFTQSNNNILSCLDAKSGKDIFDKTRLKGLEQIYASPVGAKDHIFICGRNGATVVLRRSKKFEIVSTNRIGESIVGSPALAGNQLFLRGNKSLYCLSDQATSSSKGK